jgi:hypothetical protein
MEFLKNIYAGWNKSIQISSLLDTTLFEVIKSIQSDQSVLARINQVRSLTDPIQRQDAKKGLLPYFVLNHFTDNKRTNSNFISSQYIVADFDHISSQFDKVIEKLKTDPRVLLFFRSPSNDGVKIVFALDREISDSKLYSSFYKNTISSISQEYSVTPDLSCQDPARAIFYSHDPEPFINPNYVALTVAPNISSGRNISSNSKEETVPVANLNSKTIDGLMKLFTGGAPGERTHKMTQLIGMCMNKGMDELVTLEFIKLWNTKNDPPHTDEKLSSTVSDMFRRYKKKTPLPFDIFMRDDQYFRVNLTGSDEGPTEKALTTFIIEPTELLISPPPDGDALQANILSRSGGKYEQVILESNDWTQKDLQDTIAHMDCTVHATDSEVRVLRDYIYNIIPVKKNGTKVVGLDKSETIWATKNLNITKDGPLLPMEIIPYDKGADAFFNKIEYPPLTDNAYGEMVRTFYDNILEINDSQAIVPFIAWNFVAPVRSIIMKYKKRFPILFVPGTMGSGKTSTAQLFMKLHGYSNPVVNSADMRRFPMLKALSSTNGVPIFIDEFKKSDMTDFNANDIHRYIRKSSDGGVEPKGHSDQTTTDYHLSAPWVLIGEWSINNPAEKERMVIPRFSSTIKIDKRMQESFQILDQLDALQGFMPRYIEFLLKQNIRKRYDDALHYITGHFGNMPVAPRVTHNLAIVVLGANLFSDYAIHCGLTKPDLNLPAIINGQLGEVTGNTTGQVESAMDQLVSELSKLAARQRYDSSGVSSGTSRDPWYTITELDGQAVLAFRFSIALPMVREFARKTHSDISLLDEAGYKRMMHPKEIPYLISSSKQIKMSGKNVRCVVLDLIKLKMIGVDVEGFENT